MKPVMRSRGSRNLVQTSFFFIITVVFILALLGAAASAAPPSSTTWESKPPPGPLAGAGGGGAEPNPCLAFMGDKSLLKDAVRRMTFTVGGEARAIGEVRFSGLATVPEDGLWDILGGRPTGILSVEQAAALLLRVTGTGLFETVTPTLRFEPGAGPDGGVLDIAVVEHATLKKIVVTGLAEVGPTEILDRLLLSPSPGEVERSRRVPDAAGVKAAKSKSGKDKEKVMAPRCPQPLPSLAWLARAEDGTLWPGIAWKGLREGLERVIQHLFHAGYQMATLSAALSPDGTLTVTIDEGRLEAVEIRGVDPGLEPEVRRLLGIEPGRVFLASDLEGAAARVQRWLPFLKPDKARRLTRTKPRIARATAVEPDASDDGTVRFHTVEVADEPLAVDDDLESAMRGLTRISWARVEGMKLVVYLAPDVTDLDVDATEFLRHTPVTDYAPGGAATVRVWDPRDRAHLAIAAVGSMPTRRESREATESGALVDLVVAPRVAVPALRIAELGVSLHTLTDTADRWRISSVDSYVYSLLLNRPESEYFRRAGVAAFLTTHVDQRLTAGVEYRFDHYDSMPSLRRLFTLFNRDEAPWPNPGIDDGDVGSLLLRLEWSTERTPAYRVGSHRRHPETSIVARDRSDGGARTRATTVNTLEIADPALGGDDKFRFARLVSESTLHVGVGRRSELGLRLRAAGKVGGDNALPRQRQEALGGWSALRGYDFKELRGDFSLLASLEYGWDRIVMFADVGSVRQPTGWTAARLGAGALLRFYALDLALAWRTDDRAGFAPEIRLLFNRVF